MTYGFPIGNMPWADGLTDWTNPWGLGRENLLIQEFLIVQFVMEFLLEKNVY